MEHRSNLAPGVHALKLGGTYILMDPVGDRYLSLKGSQSAWFETILSRTPAPREICEKVKQFENRLLALNLLTRDSAGDLPVVTGLAQSPEDSWFATEPPLLLMQCTGDLLRMGRSVATSWWLHRTKDFSGILSQASHWKARCNDLAGPDPERVRDAVIAFHTLTPLFFTAREACRFRSLALLRYLSLLNTPAEWVFAVRLSPFAAHCWLEWQGHVLNEHLARTKDYTEILRV